MEDADSEVAAMEAAVEHLKGKGEGAAIRFLTWAIARFTQKCYLAEYMYAEGEKVIK